VIVNYKLIVFTFGLVTMGCAAALVPATGDPYEKLSHASRLFDKQERPLPAEKLIIESIQSFEKADDKLGLAHAYRVYGFFFKSQGVEKWEKFYRENGFQDESAAFDTRLLKSIDYFDRSIPLFQNMQAYDIAVNVTLNKGFTLMQLNENSKACAAFEETLENNRRNIEAHPAAKPEAPAGFSSIEDYVAALQTKINCRK
jgi:tetratricopeptide (TPR) repeat protein